MQTPFETNGSPSTVAQGEDFCEALALAHSHVTLQQWGQPSGAATRLGMFTATVGVGPPDVGIIGSIHGDEPAGREAAMAFLRDLAETTDPAVQAYLGQHSWTFMCTANPAGTTAFTRENANGKDLNREYPKTTQPESAATAAWFLWAKPNLVVDLHEFGVGGTITAETSTATAPSDTTPAGLYSLGYDLNAAAAAALTGSGWSWQTYPWVGEQGTLRRSAVPTYKFVGQLVETGEAATLVTRIQMHMVAQQATLAHHMANAAAYTTAHATAGGAGPGAAPVGAALPASWLQSSGLLTADGDPVILARTNGDPVILT